MRSLFTSFARSPNNLISLRYFCGNARFTPKVLETFNQGILESKSLGFENRLTRDLAQKVKTSLEESASQGCEESLKIIDLMSNLSRKFSVLNFSGFEEAAKEGIYGMELCSNVLAELLGHDYGEKQRVRSVEDKRVALPPHIDGGAGTPIDMISLFGVKSSGSVKTYVINAEEVFKKLSPESLKILTAKIFTDKRTGKVFAMFGNENGKVTTNFTSHINADLDDFDPPLKSDAESVNKRLFTYDAAKIGCGDGEVEEAMGEALKIMSRLWEEDRVSKISIKTGSIIFILNKQAYHGRGDYENRHSSDAKKLREIDPKERQIGRIFYFRNGKVCEFHLPNNSVEKTVATKLSPDLQNVVRDGLH